MQKRSCAAARSEALGFMDSEVHSAPPQSQTSIPSGVARPDPLSTRSPCPSPPPQCFDELETFLEPASKKSRTPSYSNKRGSAPSKHRKLKERKRSKLAVPRWCIPTEQLVKLEEIFEHTQSPSFAVRERLANEFCATARQVRPAAPRFFDHQTFLPP